MPALQFWSCPAKLCHRQAASAIKASRPGSPATNCFSTSIAVQAPGPARNVTVWRVNRAGRRSRLPRISSRAALATRQSNSSTSWPYPLVRWRAFLRSIGRERYRTARPIELRPSGSVAGPCQPAHLGLVPGGQPASGEVEGGSNAGMSTICSSALPLFRSSLTSERGGVGQRPTAGTAYWASTRPPPGLRRPPPPPPLRSA